MADAKTEGGVGPYFSPQTKLPVGAIYRVTGTKDNKFWPLDPGHVLPDAGSNVFDAFAVPNTPVTKDTNTLVALPDYGIFDIVIQFSRDSLTEKWVEVRSFREELRREPLSGTGCTNKMYVVIDDERRARIRFAVHLPKGSDKFKGKLQLEAETAGGASVKAELKLEMDAKKSKTAANMFVFFVPHKPASGNQLPAPQYEWCKLRAVDKGGGALEGATVRIKLLRDNVTSGFETINRSTRLLSQTGGFVAYDEERVVLGLPTDWPIIFKSEMAGYVSRGHLFRIQAKETSTNLSPLYSDPAKSNRMQIRMTKTADAQLTGKLIVIDPGHGVIYADRTQAKSQEWLVVHRIADEVAQTLEAAPYSASVRWVRTAGFEAIAPGHTRRADGPEEARKRYILEFDTSRWRIRVQKTNPDSPNMQLKRMSDALLSDMSSPPKVAESRRSDLIRNNSKTVEQAITRQMDALKAGLRLEAKSMNWSAADTRYTFRVQREVPVPKKPSKWEAAGTGVFHWVEKPGRYELKVKLDKPSSAESSAVGKLSTTLTITDQDWFDLDDGMLRTLEARTVEWSVNAEVSGTTTFAGIARLAIAKNGAEAYMGGNNLEYMRNKCKWTNDLVAADPSLANDLPPPPPVKRRANELSQNRGWNANQRVYYFEKFRTSPAPPPTPNPKQPYPYADFFVSLHLNGDDKLPTPIGVLCDIASTPSVEQQRLAKIFIKYLDPFDQGTSGGGIKKSGVRMLQGGNYLKRYIFLELDFETSTSPRNSKLIQYQEMLSASIRTGEGRTLTFITEAAQQIVEAIVEILVDPQDNADVDALNHSQW